MNTGPTPLLELAGIEKAFFGVKVLRDVSFTIQPGATVGLVGENGAGKSTLMNILGGNHPPDAGTMRLGGRAYSPRSPRDAEQRGIAFIHQELNLFPNLSIAENLFISGFPRPARWLPFIHRRAIRVRTRQLLDEVGLAHPPGTTVENLSAGERQLVEIARALGADARLLLLDEPTTSLTARETDRLFALLGRLRARGLAMIYISHNLADVLRLCDSIVVLRDGAVVGSGPKSEFSVDRMVTLMVGRELGQLFPARSGRATAQPALEVRRISQPGVVRDISFQIHRGEIVGLSGLMGSGRSELARILFGLDPCVQGDVLLNGRSLTGLAPRERIARGLAFLTEDRRNEGLCLEASIADNLALAALRRFARRPFGWLAGKSIPPALDGAGRRVRLTGATRLGQPVQTLSGGNQQKVVLAKWLLNEPKVFLLDEPTRGIDVGAKVEVYRLINELADRGAAVLMISSEIEELIGMCDRILVMNRGAIHDVVEPHEFERERLLRASLHGGGPA